MVLSDRAAHEEREREKKYTGPVGKNPWGGIAKDWGQGNRNRDYADELK